MRCFVFHPLLLADYFPCLFLFNLTRNEFLTEIIFIFFQLMRAYFAFMEVLFSNHLVFVLNLDQNTFMHIVGSLESGLKSLDSGVSSQVSGVKFFYS